jgi:F-type H+-transporting ATPase subunit b
VVKVKTVIKRFIFSLSVGMALLATATVGWTADAADAVQGNHAAKGDHAHKPDAEAGHGHAGHGAHIGAEGVDTDPAEFKRDLAIYTFLVFLILLAVLRKFAWGPIAAGLDRREKTITDHIAAAEQSEADARQLLAEYEAKLAGTHDEVRAIIEEARRDAEHTHQEILAKARADAQSEMARAKREIDTAKDQALISLAESAANHAVDLAGKVLHQRLNPAEHTKLIEEALANFPKGNSHRN